MLWHLWVLHSIGMLVHLIKAGRDPYSCGHPAPDGPGPWLALDDHLVYHLIVILRVLPGLRVVAHPHLTVEGLDRDGVVNNESDLFEHINEQLAIELQVSDDKLSLILL